MSISADQASGPVAPDLDLFVYDSADNVIAQSTSPTANESVVFVHRPNLGPYRILVTSYLGSPNQGYWGSAQLVTHRTNLDSLSFNRGIWAAYKVRGDKSGWAFRIAAETTAEAFDAQVWILDSSRDFSGGAEYYSGEGGPEVHIHGAGIEDIHFQSADAVKGLIHGSAIGISDGEQYLVVHLASEGPFKGTLEFVADDSLVLDGKSSGDESFLFRQKDFESPSNVSVGYVASARVIDQGVLQMNVYHRLFGSFHGGDQLGTMSLGWDNGANRRENLNFDFWWGEIHGQFRFWADGEGVSDGFLNSDLRLTVADVKLPGDWP